MLPALRPMRPLRTGPTPFFAVSPIWWQALHTPKTFSPAAASWALTSPAPATANSATKTTARILFSCLVGALSGTEIIVLSGGTVDPTFGQPADGTSQAPPTIKVPSASTVRACRFGRIARCPRSATTAAWSLRKNFPLNPSSGSPACAISPRHAPRREKSSLIHDDQGCFSEIHQSFFFGDGLGFF